MSEIDHERWSEDLPAYLLGALEPGEAAELERHIGGLRRLPGGAALAAAGGRAAAGDGRARRAAAQSCASGSSAEAALARPAPGEGRPRRAGRCSRSWRPVVGLATVALVLAAVAGYAIRAGRVGDGGSATTVATAGRAPGVTAKVVSEGDAGDAAASPTCAQLPQDRVLEAWVRRDGQVDPGAVAVRPRQRRPRLDHDPDTRGVDVVMVTAEPPGGSASPTSVPIVTLKMPS